MHSSTTPTPYNQSLSHFFFHHFLFAPLPKPFHIIFKRPMPYKYNARSGVSMRVYRSASKAQNYSTSLIIIGISL